MSLNTQTSALIMYRISPMQIVGVGSRLSMYTALHWGIVDRRALLRLYLELPVTLLREKDNNIVKRELLYSPWDVFLSVEGAISNTSTTAALLLSVSLEDDLSQNKNRFITVASSSRDSNSLNRVAEKADALLKWRALQSSMHPTELAGGR